ILLPDTRSQEAAIILLLRLRQRRLGLVDAAQTHHDVVAIAQGHTGIARLVLLLGTRHAEYGLEQCRGDTLLATGSCFDSLPLPLGLLPLAELRQQLFACAASFIG